MNKKQAGIILALLALIVCAGVLAAKVNGNMGDVAIGDMNAGKNTFNLNKDKKDTEKKENETSSDFFFESRTLREQRDAQTLQTLKTVMDNKEASKQEKEEATKKHTTIAINQDYETRIELALKGKGFEDSLCLIENDKARVIVKSKEELSDKQRKQIQEVVMSTAKIKNVEIERKQ